MLGQDICDAVETAFARLPPSGKPRPRANGTPEWTVLAGLVAVEAGRVHVISVASGVKAMPDSIRGSARGTVVHDGHAEILCLRVFNWWLMQEVHGETRYLEAGGSKRFRLRPGVELALYVLEPPCGDALMSLVAQDKVPWKRRRIGTEPEGKSGSLGAQAEVSPEMVSEEVVSEEVPGGDHCRRTDPTNDSLLDDREQTALRGRAHFDRLGVVRTKPGRADSDVTLSKSCSDKLCLKQWTGVLNCATSLHVEPVYLLYLVLDSAKFSAADFDRCFRARLKAAPPHALKPLTCTLSKYPFHKQDDAVPLLLAIVHCAASNTTKVLNNGVKNGSYRKRKPPTEQGACFVSRHQLLAQCGYQGLWAEMKASQSEREALKREARLAMGLWPKASPDDV